MQSNISHQLDSSHAAQFKQHLAGWRGDRDAQSKRRRPKRNHPCQNGWLPQGCTNRFKKLKLLDFWRILWSTGGCRLMPPMLLAPSSPSPTWQTCTSSMSASRWSSEDSKSKLPTWMLPLKNKRNFQFSEIPDFHPILNFIEHDQIFQPQVSSSLSWGAAIGIFLGAFAVAKSYLKFKILCNLQILFHSRHIFWYISLFPGRPSCWCCYSLAPAEIQRTMRQNFFDWHHSTYFVSSNF